MISGKNERPTFDEVAVAMYVFLLEEFSDPHAVAPIKFKAFALQTSPSVMQGLLAEDQKLLDAKNAPPPAAKGQSEPAYAPGHEPKSGQRAAESFRGNPRIWNPKGESKDIERKPSVPLPANSPFIRLGQVVQPTQQPASHTQSTNLMSPDIQQQAVQGVAGNAKPLSAAQRAKLVVKVAASGTATEDEAAAALGLPLDADIQRAASLASVKPDQMSEADKDFLIDHLDRVTAPALEEAKTIFGLTLTDDDLAEIIAMNPKSVTEAYDPNRLRAFLAENEIPFKDTASDRQVAGALITWLKTRPIAK